MNSLASTMLVRECGKRAIVRSVVALLGLSFTALSVYAEGRCTLQTISGTYAGYERGSSLLLSLSPQPNPPAWAAPAIAPFANVFEFTIRPDGTGDGFYWIWAGSIAATVDSIPVHVTITEMNDDCTGKIAYTANLPGGFSSDIVERFIAFDNGREFQSVPISTGMPGVTWIGTAHRISKGVAPVTSGGPHAAKGTYLLSCENYVAVNATTAVSAAFLMRIDVSKTAEYTGALYEKLGQLSVDGHPVSGTWAVNPDFSLTGTLYLPDLNSTINVRGVFYNEGHDVYVMAAGNQDTPTSIKFSTCQGTRIGQ
jgi:hypothetical protein